MTHTGVIVMLDGSNGVVQSGQQIVFDIAHIAGFLLQTLKDIFQMAAAESEQLIPYQFSGQFLAGDGEILRFGAQDFHNLVYDLIQALMAILLAHDVVVDVVPDQLLVLGHHAGLLMPAR